MSDDCLNIDAVRASGEYPLPEASITGIETSYKHNDEYELILRLDHIITSGIVVVALDTLSQEVKVKPPTAAASEVHGEEYKTPLMQDRPSLDFQRVEFCPSESEKELKLKIPKSHIFHGETYWTIQLRGLHNCTTYETYDFTVTDYDNIPKVEIQSVTEDIFKRYKIDENTGEETDEIEEVWHRDKSVMGGTGHNPYGNGRLVADSEGDTYPSGESNLLWFKLRRTGPTVHEMISVNLTPTFPPTDQPHPFVESVHKIKGKYLDYTSKYVTNPVIFPSSIHGGSGHTIQEAYLAIEIPEEHGDPEDRYEYSPDPTVDLPRNKIEITLLPNGETDNYYVLKQNPDPAPLFDPKKVKSAFIDSSKENSGIIAKSQKETLFFEPVSGVTTTTTTTTLAPMLKREFGEFSSGGSNSLPQHVFLGASVADFSLNGGFGDSVTTMNVTLVEDSVTNTVHKRFDHFGKRRTNSGTSYVGTESLARDGVDTDGEPTTLPPRDAETQYDIEVGDPVFFCFGESLQTPMTGHNKSHVGVPTSGPFSGATSYPDDGFNGFNKLIYDLYHYTSSANASSPHFAFGGLLQSWNTNVDATGGTMHNVTIVDPREILQNFQLILNNHTGTTFGNDNLLNIYGFLEHIFTTSTNGNRDARYSQEYYMKNSWTIPESAGLLAPPFFDQNGDPTTPSVYSSERPITGIGYSLRSELGIPCFRVIQALNMLTGFHNWSRSGDPWTQYYQYGGYCRFKGKKYAIDIADVPIPDPHYHINYDSMSLLDFCMEMADACNHEIMVHLLPFTNSSSARPWGAVAHAKFASHNVDGIIKVSTINRNLSAKVSQTYIDTLPFDVTSKDIGEELVNEVTDKFVTGANEVAHYYFDGKQDRENNSAHGRHEINRNLSKGIIPYYGLLHNNVVTFPRGRGPWTQIVLDATACQAMGVGEFYVTTEMELRAADISFDKWVEFLQSYNHVFHEVIFDDTAIDNLDMFSQGLTGSIAQFLGIDGFIVGTRECTVPRCTHPPCKIDKLKWQNGQNDEQWCSPPYGYPLYWGRAGAIGIFTGSNTGGSNKNPKAVDPKGVAPNAAANQAKPKSNASKQTGNDANKNFEDSVSAYMTKLGVENAKKVFAFVKAVADECLGKKFLIKIPQTPNLNYGSGKWFFGFAPRDEDDSIPAVNIGAPTDAVSERPDGSYNYAKHKAHINPTTAISASTTRKRGALTIGYNAAIGEYVFNYYPEPAGGNDPPYGNYAPPIIRSFFEENGRVPAYVRLPYDDNINMDSFDKDGTFKYSYNKYTLAPAVRAGDGSWPESTKHTIFVKADLDERFFVAPVMSSEPVPLYGVTAQRRADLEATNPGKKYFDEDGKEKEVNFVMPQVWGPKKTPSGGTAAATAADLDSLFGADGDTDDIDNPFDDTTVITTPEDDSGTNTGPSVFGDPLPGDISVLHIDLDKALDAIGPSDYFHVYALITIPRATLTEEGTESYGESMKVNASNVDHFFREDVVKGMPGFATVSTPTFTRLEGGSNAKDYKANTMKAVEGLSFCLDRRIKMFSPGPLFPEMVALPLRSTERSYGPWYSSTKGGGKVEYSHDESLAPWNYNGSYAAMNTAGFDAVTRTEITDLKQERASFTMLGWPRGMSIGGFLSYGGPAITNINVSFSTDGIRTTVTMDSYTPSFGKMQKQKQAMMSKMMRDKQQIKDSRNKLIKEQILNPRSNSSISKEEAKFRKKAQAEKDRNYGSKLTAEEKGEAQAANQFAMTVNVQVGQSQKKTVTGKDASGNNTYSRSEATHVDANGNPDHGDFASKAVTSVTAAVQSSKATGDAGKLLSENAFQYYKQYWLSISSSIDEVFHPASATWHNIFPSMDQPIDLLLYKDSIDDDNEISYYD